MPAGWEETPWVPSGMFPAGMISIDPATLEEMVRFRNIRGRPCDYVPSGILTPSYRAMTEDALGYYLFWRDSVRRGRFPRTDIGYIRLLFSEMVSTEGSPRDDIELMARIVREYMDLNIFQMAVLGDACLCHARLNGLPLPRIPVLKEPDAIAFQVFEAIRSEPVGYLSVRNIMTLFGVDATLPEGVPVDAMYLHIIRGIDSTTRRITGCRISDGTGTVRRQMPVYRGLIYHGDRRSFALSIPPHLPSTTLGDTLRSALLTMLAGLGCDGIVSAFDGTEDLVYTMTVNTLESYYDGTLELDDPDATFHLDHDAIVESENDLRAVTEMMRIEDDEPDPTVSEPAPEVTTPAGWEGLGASFDDSMAGYLRAAVEGTATGLLDGRGRTAMEKAINTLSMDAIGDVIVEDGTIIPDYLDEVSELLRCR